MGMANLAAAQVCGWLPLQQLQDCGTHLLGLMGAQVGRAVPLSFSPSTASLFSAQEQLENGRGCATSVREGVGGLKYLQTLKISLHVAALSPLLWLSKYTQVNAQIANYYCSTPYLQIYLQFSSQVIHSAFTLLSSFKCSLFIYTCSGHSCGVHHVIPPHASPTLGAIFQVWPDTSLCSRGGQCGKVRPIHFCGPPHTKKKTTKDYFSQL